MTPKALLTMREQTVAGYCLPADLLRFTRPAGTPSPATNRRLTDAQVLTTALVAARFFGGNLVVATRNGGQKRLDKSGFVCRLHALIALVGEVLKRLHLEARYMLGSFLVAVCHKIRQKHLGRDFHAVSC